MKKTISLKDRINTYIYITLLIGCFVLSTITSIFGVLPLCNNSIILAVVSGGIISLLMLYANINIYENSDRIYLYVIVYVFSLLLSVLTNFNAIYINTAKKEMIYQELANKKNDFLVLKNKSLTSLESFYGYNRKKNTLDSLKSLYESEVGHPNRPGLGNLSNKIYAKIVEEEAAFGNIEREYIDIKSEIELKATHSISILDSVLFQSEIYNIDDVLKIVVNEYNDIVIQTKGVVGDSVFSYKELNHDNSILGRIDYSISVLQNIDHFPPNIQSSVKFGFGLSCLIDLIPFLLSFLGAMSKKTKKQKPKKDNKITYN